MTTKHTASNSHEGITAEREDFGRSWKLVTGKDELISVLERVQEKYGYLPEEALRAVADKTGRSLVDIYGVATFYSSFSLKPRGRHTICACLGTACHVRGAKANLEELKKQLGIDAGETTDDNEITLETANCLGSCASGPILTIDGRYLSNVDPSMTKGIIEGTKAGFLTGNGHDGLTFPLKVSCAQCGTGLLDPTHPIDGHPSILLQHAGRNGDGRAWFSSLYGSCAFEQEIRSSNGDLVDFSCPHCKALLTDAATRCVECDSPMATVLVNGGEARLRLCSRSGCLARELDLETGNCR